MKNRFSIEVTTGNITRTVDGVEVTGAAATSLFARNILDAEAVLTRNGADVTTTVLTGKQLVAGVRKMPGQGCKIATSSGYALASGVASFTLSLNTAEAVATAGNQPGTFRKGVPVFLEFQVYDESGTYRETLAQRPFTLYPEVNRDGEESPQAAEVSAVTAGEYAAIAEAAALSASASAGVALATHAELRLIPTASGATPQRAIRSCYIGGVEERFIGVNGTGSEIDDDAGRILPADFNASTNPYVWTRIG